MNFIHKNISHSEFFKAALQKMSRKDILKYQEMRLLYEHGKVDKDFCQRFNAYYGLNSAGLSTRQINKFHTLLAEKWRIESENDYRLRFHKIIHCLYDLKNKRGQNTVQASFASKLLAFKNDEFPIFDTYVSNYFGFFMPKEPSLEFRVDVFVNNMLSLKSTYEELAERAEIAAIINTFVEQYKIQVSPTRALDFLVYTIGRNKIYKEISLLRSTCLNT